MNTRKMFAALAFAASTLVLGAALSGCGGSSGGGDNPMAPGPPLVVKVLELSDPEGALNSVCRGVTPGERTFDINAVFEGPSVRSTVEVEGPPGDTLGGVRLGPGNNMNVPVKTKVNGSDANPLGLGVHLYADDGQKAYKSYRC